MPHSPGGQKPKLKVGQACAPPEAPGEGPSWACGRVAPSASVALFSVCLSDEESII